MKADVTKENVFVESVKRANSLQLHYYYDQSGKWLKFSDFIAKQRYQFEPQFVEDIYALYGNRMPNRKSDIHRNIYFLDKALRIKYRHPSVALCSIESANHHYKYRLLITMHLNVLLGRLFLRLGSLYDKPDLKDYHLDVADDLEKSFRIAYAYYKQSIPFFQRAEQLAQKIGDFPFYLDLATLESEAYLIRVQKINYGRILNKHIKKLQQNSQIVSNFLDREGRPRPVKEKMKEHIRSMYDDDFLPSPLEAIQ